MKQHDDIRQATKFNIDEQKNTFTARIAKGFFCRNDCNPEYVVLTSS